jgi:hypothetical protein
MIKVKSRFISSVLVLIPLFIAGGLAAREKTMERVDDPVVMECKDLGPLFGSPINKLALMALSRDDWAPIPFQIDQKKPDGTYAFTMGPEASEDPDPDLDANDELVFMVKDIGGSVEAGEDTVWPEGEKSIMEIEVTDPNNGQKGWAYLARFSGVAPRSDDDYIRLDIDAAKGRRGVITDEYVSGAPSNTTCIDYLAARKLPDGSEGVDVLDRLKIRGELIFPGDISVDINADEMVKVEDKAYIDGPVRVLHLADGYMEFFGFIKVRGTGYSTVSYYVNHSIFPVTLNAPPDLPEFVKKLLPEVRLAGFLDFNENIYGSHPFNAANPYNKEVVLDGRMSEAEKNLDRLTPVEWVAGFGPQGAIVSRLELGAEAAGIEKLTYYVDDQTVDDSPEDDPGLTGVGYNLEGITQEGEVFSSGTFKVIVYFKSDLKPEEVEKILDIIDHPVTVSTRRVK